MNKRIVFYNEWELCEFIARIREEFSQFRIKTSTYSCTTISSTDNDRSYRRIIADEIVSSEVVEIIGLCNLESTSSEWDEGWTDRRSGSRSSDTIFTHDRTIDKELIPEDGCWGIVSELGNTIVANDTTIENICSNDIGNTWTHIEVSPISIFVFLDDHTENTLRISIIHVSHDPEVRSSHNECFDSCDSTGRKYDISSIFLDIHDRTAWTLLDDRSCGSCTRREHSEVRDCSTDDRTRSISHCKGYIFLDFISYF